MQATRINVATGESEVFDLPDEELIAHADLVPSVISRRQFFQQCHALGLIEDADEALDAAAMMLIPAAMLAVINTLPPDQITPAKFLVRTAASFERDNVLVQAFGAALGKTSAELDALWAAAAGL